MVKGAGAAGPWRSGSWVDGPLRNDQLFSTGEVHPTSDQRSRRGRIGNFGAPTRSCARRMTGLTPAFFVVRGRVRILTGSPHWPQREGP